MVQQLVLESMKNDGIMFSTFVAGVEDLDNLTLRNVTSATFQVVYDVNEFLQYQGDINNVELCVEGQKVGFAVGYSLNGKIYVHFLKPEIVGFEKGFDRVAYLKTGKLLSVFGFPFRLEKMFEELVTQ